MSRKSCVKFFLVWREKERKKTEETRRKDGRDIKGGKRRMDVGRGKS